MNNKRIKLFDGFEDDLYNQEFQLKGNQGMRTIEMESIYKNDFEKLKEKIPESNFNAIIKDLDIIKHTEMFDSYKSCDDQLEMYYLIDGNDLFIFSHGERQPARYQLYFEGLYNMQQLQNVKLKL
ncbi:hypothetical protein [uncultured Chryseobacterium sp.]|jgi:hypothetical protein|uniref:hypothetical protein n=1 Tax=uncultured Chryseobacterium sp. TaxID=259322 RepID=UPI00263231F8|nr:hypothetical protein [uncultured Chryseobacterium sp.]